VLERSGEIAEEDGTVGILEHAAAAAEAAVTELGHATPGDKTLVDALHPLAESLARSASEHANVGDAVARAVEAAERGAQATAGMVATVGRASRLGERSRGLPDAGASSLSIIVRAMADATPLVPPAGRGPG
jgi:dihydroxyacetone kinase